MSNPLEKLFGDKAAVSKADALQRTAPAAPPPPKKTVPGVTDKQEEKDIIAELEAEAVEPDDYCAYIARPHPVLCLDIVEKNGAHHGFQYHTMRNIVYQVKGGKEFLTFYADGLIIGIEGRGLLILYFGLLRHVLVSMREYDGKPISNRTVHISVVEIADPAELVDGENATLKLIG